MRGVEHWGDDTSRGNMKNRAFTTLLRIEVGVIILLIGCLIISGVWSFGKKNAAQRQISASKKASQQVAHVKHRSPERTLAAPRQARRQIAISPDIIGFASYYQDAFHGLQTASGERYDMNRLTAAHRDYPFGTRLRVTNLRNGKQVVVRVNDRGPENPERLIDLSSKAAQRIGLRDVGVTQVKLDIVR